MTRRPDLIQISIKFLMVTELWPGICHVTVTDLIFYRNWAVELFGGNTGKDSDNNSTYSEFNINVVLTDKGFQHYQKVSHLIGIRTVFHSERK